MIRGTLDRSTAVTHESVRFFAPGDPLVDRIIGQSAHSRARAAAILRRVHGLSANLAFLALTYRALLDPRPFLARGYLCPPSSARLQLLADANTYRLLGAARHDRNRSQDAESRPLLEIRRGDPNDDDTDLGSAGSHHTTQTDAATVRMAHTHRTRPTARGEPICSAVVRRRPESLQRHDGDLWAGLESEQATMRWLYGYDKVAATRIANSEQMANLVLSSLAQPLWYPESAIFWYLQGRKHA